LIITEGQYQRCDKFGQLTIIHPSIECLLNLSLPGITREGDDQLLLHLTFPLHLTYPIESGETVHDYRSARGVVRWVVFRDLLGISRSIKIAS